MQQKFYDLCAYGSGGIDPYVVSETNDNKKIVIHCECGAHMLKVICDTDTFTNSDGSVQQRQEIYLAMFNYGSGKRPFWERIKIAFNYLKTGEMFNDQLCLTKDEASNLRDFLNIAIPKNQ